MLLPGEAGTFSNYVLSLTKLYAHQKGEHPATLPLVCSWVCVRPGGVFLVCRHKKPLPSCFPHACMRCGSTTLVESLWCDVRKHNLFVKYVGWPANNHPCTRSKLSLHTHLTILESAFVVAVVSAGV